jgi:tRNA (mo5U34)-methyltransferase
MRNTTKNNSETPTRFSHWTTATIEQRVRDLGEWFHNMDLGGVQTAPRHFLGDYPSIKWQHFAHIIPEDLRGKSVLDIGCNAGFYSLEMKRRGAERVVAIDSDEKYLAQARFAAEVKGLDIEFLQMSVYDVADLKQKFDIVLFLGVLYHLRHPLLALDLLRQCVVGDKLVMQSMLRGGTIVARLAPNYPFEETAIFNQTGFPKMYFVENKYCDDETNWWIPNNAGMEAMLRSAGFRILDHPETEVYLCCKSTSPIHPVPRMFSVIEEHPPSEPQSDGWKATA